MFQQENKNFSDKYPELFSADAMKQLEKDFQNFDGQRENGFFAQTKGSSTFPQFDQSIFADLKSESLIKQIMNQNAALQKEVNSLKDSDRDAKSRKIKREGKGTTQKEQIDEPEFEEVVEFLSPSQTPAVDHDRKLFTEMLYPDIHFQVGQQLIPAHRYIFLTRCPAFGRMFTSGMIESKTSVIQLQDVRPETFQAFLEFIYCGEVTLTDFQVSVELLNEADKYFLAELKKRIGRYLKSQINLKNVIEIANLAELHEVDQLREAAFKFILTNFVALFERENNTNQLTDLLDSCLIQLFKRIKRKNDEF